MRSNLVHFGHHAEMERFRRFIEKASRKEVRAAELIKALKGADDWHAWLASRYDTLNRRTDIGAVICVRSDTTPHIRQVTESVATEKKHRHQASCLLHGSAIANAVATDRDVEQMVSIVYLDVPPEHARGAEFPADEINRLQIIGYDEGEIADPLARKEFRELIGDRSAKIMTIGERRLLARAQSFVLQQEAFAEEQERRRENARNLLELVLPKEIELDFRRASVKARWKISDSANSNLQELVVDDAEGGGT